MSETEAGQFKDNAGRVWFCAPRGERRTMMCHSADGHVTAADQQTFKRWNWKRVAPTATDIIAAADAAIDRGYNEGPG